MPIDLNTKRRSHETTIALAVADEFSQNITSCLYTAPQELLAHHFGLVCQRFNFMPTEESAKRIFGYVWKEISARRWETEQLAAETAKHREAAERLLADLVK